ncbi:MAG: hypothetical protein GY855_01375, partial [candidate division Zixibacteria bacterium]|nr:hypothetical protein [candidate division Zixibacteria bacterium]
GVENIFKHNVSLVDRLLDFLKHSNFYQINSSLETPKRSSIISVKCDEVEKLNTFLTERKIIISLREGGIRISPHLYNNTDDIDCLIEALLQFEKEKHGK